MDGEAVFGEICVGELSERSRAGLPSRKQPSNAA